MVGRRLGLLLVVVLGLVVALAGCGGGDDGASDGAASAGDGDGTAGDGSATPAPPASDDSGGDDSNVDFDALTIVPTPMHSGFDGENDFQLPAYVEGTATAPEDWSAEPSDAVSLAPWMSDDGSQVGVMITVVKYVSEVEISVRSGVNGGRSTLKVTMFTPAQTAAGRDRYTMGESFDLDAFINMNSDSMMVPGDLRCDTCHSSTAENLQVMNTPTQTAVYSDDELRDIFTMGLKPPAVGFRTLPPFVQPFYPLFHTWDASPDQIDGLIAYLRSLTPEGQGEIIRPDTSGLPDLPPVCLPQDPMYDMEACDSAIMMFMMMQGQGEEG